jgi:hypothetical protein
MAIKNIETVSLKKMIIIITAIMVLLGSLSSILVMPSRPISTLLFDPGVNISQNSNLSLSLPYMSTYGDNVYVIWTARSAHSSNVFFKSIGIGTQTKFGNTVNLSHDSGFSTSPRMLAYKKSVYVLWESNATSLNFKASKNNGTTFDKSITLGHNIALSGSPQIAAYGDNVYVIWQGVNANGISNIYLRASKNNGTTFDKSITLGHNIALSGSPQIAAYGDNVYVIWQGVDASGISNIYLRASKNNGTTFDKSITLGHNIALSGSPQIAAYGDNVYVIWQGVNANGISNIYLRASKNNGTTSSLHNISSNKTGISSSPQIAAYGDNVYVIWQGVDASGISNIYLRASKNNGKTLFGVNNVTASVIGAGITFGHNTAFFRSPQIAAYGDNVYVIWQGVDAQSSNIYFKSIGIGAQTKFGNTINLSHDSGFSTSAQIAASSHNIYVIWSSNIAGNTNIYFNRIRSSMVT